MHPYKKGEGKKCENVKKSKRKSKRKSKKIEKIKENIKIIYKSYIFSQC